MRSRLLFLLAPLPVAIVAASFSACSSPVKLDDLCGWLGDPNNCYRQLALDSLDRCGAFGTDLVATEGQFSAKAERTALETCVLTRGGNVKFDPPLDVTKFPPASQLFVITNKDGTICGSGSIGTNDAFSITIDPSPVVAEGSTCVEGTDQICGGTFSFTPGTGKNFSVSCPAGPSFQFSHEQTAKCDADQSNGGLAGEEKLDQLIPRGELLTNAGGVGIDGYAKFRVYYPLDLPVSGPTGKDSMTGTTMKVVEYFNCKIPGAAATCSNGVLDGDEADIDCGVVCQRGCADADNCQFPQDCESAYCAFNAMGILKCSQNPNCGNATQDDLETDVDCGGVQCTKCDIGNACVENTDCLSGNCASKVCATPLVDAGVPDSAP